MRSAILILAIVITSISACNNKRGNSNDEGRIEKSIPNDTFNAASIETNPRLQQDILLDTIRDSDEKYGRTLVVPRSLKQELPGEYERLDHFIQKGWQDDPSDGADSLVESNEVFEQQVKPLSLYEDSSLVSYCFSSTLMSSGAMRHFFTYLTINYDLKLKKRVSFHDFFITD